MTLHGQQKLSSHAAFSLLEMSVVIVIIGLLLGAILGGKTVIRASELRSVGNDLEQIQTAMNNFREKYSGLPGDLKDATNYWGIQAGSTGNNDTCYTSPTTSGTATCNGNGDGIIDSGYSTTNYAERGRFWQHLANAGLIEGQYTGYQGAYGAESRVGGVNAMASRLGSTHYNAAYINSAAGDADNFPLASSNTLSLGTDFTTEPEPARTILTADELASLDNKIDDGKPAFGTIRGPVKGSAFDPNCTTDTTTAAKYNLNSKGKTCYFRFVLNTLGGQ